MNINCKGKLLNLDQPKVMGILNVTPDSFYDGGENNSIGQIINKVSQFAEEGAHIIDIGGMSSRPGAKIISPKEEIERIVPAIKYIVENHSEIFISIDTIHGEVAEEALSLGAHIINDISSSEHDNEIIQVAIKNKAPYIAMHMLGMPENMQDSPVYEDVTLDILKYFDFKIREFKSQGLTDVIIDPGFGFGKSLEHNYTLLNKLKSFNILDVPVLVGLSRKSMIYKPLGIGPENALSGTSALHMVALQNGAKILRVHDVKEAIECIDLYRLLSN